MPDPTRVRSSRRTLLKASAALALAHGAAPRDAGAKAATPTAATPGASPGATPTADPDFAALDAFVRERMAARGVPGVAVGAILGDREHAAGFGVTNVDHPLPVDAGTLFRIGSTTKTYTGTALMRLVEQGKLDFDAPVRTYLPDFQVADEAVAAAVTLRHLINHTAGWFGDDLTDPGNGDDALARYVAEMADLPQIAPVGRHFSYNNASLVVAGRVIEVVTGQPYEAAIKGLVLAPLGMERSFFFAHEVVAEAVAVGHDAPEGEPVVIGPWAIPRAGNPAGGIVSDVRDVLRFARFHLGSGTGDGTAGGERVLSAASLARMRTPHGPGGALGPEILDGTGVTWLLSTVDGARVVQHGGSINGQQCELALVPERGFAAVVLTNANAGATLGEEVTAWALGRFVGLRPAVAVEQPLPAALAAGIGGRYGDPATTMLEVAEREGALVATPLQAGEPIPGLKVTLRFVGDDRFVSDLDGTPFYTDAVRDAAGAVGWLRFSGRLYPRSRRSPPATARAPGKRSSPRFPAPLGAERDQGVRRLAPWRVAPPGDGPLASPTR